MTRAKALASFAALLFFSWLIRDVPMVLFYVLAALAAVGVIGAVAWVTIRDRLRTAAIDARYGRQLAALAPGGPEQGSSSPEPVAVDADHVPVVGTVSS